MTKYDNTPDSKIMMGCLWDFDAAFMSDALSQAFYIRWFAWGQLFSSNNKAFVSMYKSKWKDIHSKLFCDLFDYLENINNKGFVDDLDKSLTLDKIRWNKDYRTAKESISFIKDYFTERESVLNDCITSIRE